MSWAWLFAQVPRAGYGGGAVVVGYVFIADLYNYRIVKRLASDLSYVSKIGTEGIGDDQFDLAAGIEVSGDYVFVADTDNERIMKRLASDLSFVSKIGTNGSGDDQFNWPNDIAASGDYVFVADTYNHRIVKRLASDLSYVSKIGTEGSGDDQFSYPFGIAVLGDYVYVADSFNNRIVKRLASDLSYVSQIGTQGSGDDQFHYPYGIAALGDYVYVADTYNHRIVKRLASDLSYISKIGTQGSGDDQFEWLHDIAALGDYVFVADSDNNRIVKRLASDLSYVSEIGTLGTGNDQFDYPFGIAVGYGAERACEYGNCVFIPDYPDLHNVKRLRKSDLTQEAAISYGQFIMSIVADSTHVYVGGGTVGTANYRAWKILRSDMSKIAESANYGTEIRVMADDADFLYIGVNITGRGVRKLRKSDLVQVAEGPVTTFRSYLTGLAVDADFVYVSGIPPLWCRKLLKSDLTSLATVSYGSYIRAQATDDDYVYITGDAATVWKLQKSNLAKVVETAALSSRRIMAIAVDDNHVYFADDDNNKIKRLLKTDLTSVDESIAFGGYTRAIRTDDDFVYICGYLGTTKKLRKSDLVEVAESAYGSLMFTLAVDPTV